MDTVHALTAAGQALAFASLCLTALLSAAGTLRGLLSHANFISVQERGKIGAVLDRFSLICEKGKKGLVWVLSLPGFASQPKDAPAPDVSKVVPLLLVGLLAATAGCPTVQTKVGDTTAQKFQQDAAAVQAIAKDVAAKCGQQFAPFAPLFASALAVAADPYNALADIMAAVAAIPAIAQDVKGLQCVVKTIGDGYRSQFKSAPSDMGATSSVSEMADAVIALLEAGVVAPSAPTDMACASR